MTEADAFERLNAWGIARDGEVLDLKASLANTQAAVGAAFGEAHAALLTIVGNFRQEAEALRQHLSRIHIRRCRRIEKWR